LPLMSAMQGKSDIVEAQAREQQEAILSIAKGSHGLDGLTKANRGRLDELTAAVEELAASIEEGQRSTQRIEEETGRVEGIFKEEVFVSQKVNSLDRFIFDMAKGASSVAEAGHSLVNEYQKISVLNGASYVWQGESWLVTDSGRLPPGLRDKAAALGRRVLVCVGQTDDNPSFPQGLDMRAGILAIRPIADILDDASPLQGFRDLLARANLGVGDLEEPGRIDNSRDHANMAVIEEFEGGYLRVMRDKIAKGRLASAFSFGGAFANGDLMINLFLSNYKRHRSDAEKFGMIGESMVLAFESLIATGRYWRA
ncbi:MAG TPA: hypothetical protein VMV44_14885, partial [Rectinemataceae bacterium]|nr:hypothetical protein [Rectinemataceae bacterium]